MNNKVMAAFKLMCRTVGGPRQYLQQAFKVEDMKKGFLDYICQTSPKKGDVEYQLTLPLPKVHRIFRGQTRFSTSEATARSNCILMMSPMLD